MTEACDTQGDTYLSPQSLHLVGSQSHCLGGQAYGGTMHEYLCCRIATVLKQLKQDM